MDHHLTIQKQQLNKNKDNDDDENKNDDKKSKKRGRKAKNKNNKKKKNGKYNDNQEDELEKILRYSTINLILSPLRKRSPLDEWNPREIALFESGMCSKGKQFYEISKIIGSKNTKQCVEFYYYWKQSSHYAVWKALGRKTNKQITRSQKKLHKKIGQKFAAFHSMYSKKQQNDNQRKNGQIIDNVNNNQQNIQQQQQTHSIQNDINMSNTNNAMFVQQQQQQQSQQAMGNLIGYYPQYYQNGYPWYTNPAYAQQYQQYLQHHQQMQQQPIRGDSPNGGSVHNGNNGNNCNNSNHSTQASSPKHNNNHNNNHNHNNNNNVSKDDVNNNNNDKKKSDFIDLTETASSKDGSRSPNNESIEAQNKKNKVATTKKSDIAENKIKTPDKVNKNEEKKAIDTNKTNAMVTDINDNDL